MRLFGLIGHPLSHSFSKKYFTNKFSLEGISDCEYRLFDIENINILPQVITQNNNLVGLNVTIPYKESVLGYLDTVENNANEIGAVNTIKIHNGKLTGFNTDYLGFKQSLKPFLKNTHERALILGTGGASKAVIFALKELGIKCLFVSRNPKSDNEINYSDVNEYVIKHHQIIINTTPLGMFPNIKDLPDLPYQYITDNHLLYDLIYNPIETEFLRRGKEKDALILNGLDMLKIQAEKAWEIWND